MEKVRVKGVVYMNMQTLINQLDASATGSGSSGFFCSLANLALSRAHSLNPRMLNRY